QHAGVRALQHQGIHGRCIVACHAVPSSEMVWGPKLRPLCTANGTRCKLVLPGLTRPPTATEALRPGTRSQPAQKPPWPGLIRLSELTSRRRVSGSTEPPVAGGAEASPLHAIGGRRPPPGTAGRRRPSPGAVGRHRPPPGTDFCKAVV